MNIIIQSLGFTASNDLENFIRDKVNVLKSHEIIKANITLYVGPETEPENNYCEILLENPGNDHFVKKNSVHFEVAISECIDVLNKMINKTKGIHRNKRQVNPSEIQDIISENAGEVELEDLVK